MAAADEADFEEDMVKKVIIDVIEANCTPEKILNANQFKDFSHTIVDDIYKELMKQKKMFKYSATVFLQQKTGAAVNFGSAMYVDNAADGQVSFFYNENKFYDLAISVAGFKITQK